MSRRPLLLTAAAAAALVVVVVVAVGGSSHGRRGAAGSRAAIARLAGVGRARYTRLVFSDGFDGPAGTSPSPARWVHDIGAYGAPDHELQTYTDSPANASLDGHGHLAIVARAQTTTGPDGVTRDFTSARLQTGGRFSVRYGLIEARMKIPAGAGLWSAFWMLGDDVQTVGWPLCGEIDVMEDKGQDPFTARATLHGPRGGAGLGYSYGHDVRSSGSLAAGFHTYAVDWSPNAVTWLLDGVPYRTVTSAELASGQQWVFNRPFHLLLNLAVGGAYPGPPDAATRFPATLLVDWVKVYE